MTRDELEFSISQYLDGALAAPERDALEERLATDAEARALFSEYETLQGVLGTSPLPDVRWDALAAHISRAVSREELPAQSYKINQWVRPRVWALAASVLIAGGIGFGLLRDNGDGGGAGRTGVAQQPISIVVNDTPATPPTTVIAIGPEPSADNAPIVLRYADTVVQRPSKALIVSAAPAAQDSLLTPF